VHDERSDPPSRRHSRGPLALLYEVVLERIEWAVIALLLAAVITLSFGEILNRNLELTIWDSAAANRVTFTLTFYLGLFGGVLATRQSRHIAIDAVTPYLGLRVRAVLSGVLLVGSAVVAAWIAITAKRYVLEVIEADERFLPGKVEWYWRDRLWKWPLPVGFALMSLHFLVAGVGRLYAALTSHGDGLERPEVP
jgi:TRAP-type C4-dicarboxylate transport system permease small subunit